MCRATVKLLPDLQGWNGIREFYLKNEGYLQGQIGNPDGDDKPNKKFYDPRVWVRAAQVSMVERLQQAFRRLERNRLAVRPQVPLPPFDCKPPAHPRRRLYSYSASFLIPLQRQ